ncbi:hypothetical protein CDD83_6474 [Cordyceps sp. RAO-2017]|nr:hypothetical protein CDD83_6474 [Cordyceps sp. RAO-2017]
MATPENKECLDLFGAPLSPDGAALSDVLESLETDDDQASDSSASETARTQELSEGSECAIQTLYEGPPKCKCCKNWVEEYPDDLRMDVEEQPETKKKALVVRMCKNHDKGKPLALDSVVVQSLCLKKILCEVFEGYKGVTASLKSVVFKSPFRPFHYRWDRFTTILERQKQDDPDAAAFTQLLYDTLDAELREGREEIKDHLHHGVITYPLLWALFEPGTLVFTTQEGLDRFLIVSSCGYHEDGYLRISAKFVDWDGEKFGYASAPIIVCEFDGTRDITDLHVHPASFLSSREEKEAKAISRGQKFHGLAGFRYMAFSGMMREEVDARQSVTWNVRFMSFA